MEVAQTLVEFMSQELSLTFHLTGEHPLKSRFEQLKKSTESKGEEKISFITHPKKIPKNPASSIFIVNEATLKYGQGNVRNYNKLNYIKIYNMLRCIIESYEHVGSNE